MNSVLKFPEPAADLALVPRQNTDLIRLATNYVRGRVERSEIKPRTGAQVLITLRGLGETFGDRPVSNLSRSDIERWIATRRTLSPGSRRLEVAMVRRFVRWLQRERHITRDPMIDIPTPKVPRSVPRALSDTEIGALMAALPDSRARAAVALMRGLGLRRAEVVSAQVGDWDRTNRTLFVTGKGGHQRVIPVPEHVAEILNAYLAETGIRAGVMIRSQTDNGPIGVNRLGILMSRWMRTAGIKSRAYDGRGCHSLRHTLASSIVDVEPDLRVVQHILGHVHLSSTQIYLRAAALDKVRAAMENAA